MPDVETPPAESSKQAEVAKFLNPKWIAMEITRLLVNKLETERNVEFESKRGKGWQKNWKSVLIPITVKVQRTGPDGRTGGITAIYPRWLMEQMWERRERTPIERPEGEVRSYFVEPESTAADTRCSVQVMFDWHDYEDGVKRGFSMWEIQDQYWDPVILAMEQAMMSSAEKNLCQT